MSQATEAIDQTVEMTEVGEQFAGKYLTFLLGEEEYGIEILKVQYSDAEGNLGSQNAGFCQGSY